MIDTFQKKGHNIAVFEARELEEQTNTAIMGQNARRKQKGSKILSFHSHHKFYFVDNDCNEDSKIIVVSSTQDKNDNPIDSMVRFSKVVDNQWWKEQEANDDQNYADLSPQLIKSTTDLPTNNRIVNTSNFQEIFELFPKPDVILEEKKVCNESKACDESEQQSLFLFKSIEGVLEQMDNAQVSKEEKPIFCKNNVKDSNVPSDCAAGKYHQYGRNSYVQIEYIDDDTLSSSSDIYESFDDVSILTNEDSSGNVINKDTIDGKGANSGNALINLRTFEDTTLLTDDILKENDNTHAMMCSLSQDKMSLDQKEEEEKCSFADVILEEKKDIWNEFNGHNSNDFYNGICYEEGFSPKDELRLA